MGNAIKVVVGLAAIAFVLLAFGPGGFLAGDGSGSSTGIGTIGVAEEYKKRQQGGASAGPTQRGVEDTRFLDAPGARAEAGNGTEAEGEDEYDFFGTAARALGLDD
ncbi:MAG: hypothetical protein AAF371_16810 [Pseudomonadota bacterium]